MRLAIMHSGIGSRQVQLAETRSDLIGFTDWSEHMKDSRNPRGNILWLRAICWFFFLRSKLFPFIHIMKKKRNMAETGLIGPWVACKKEEPNRKRKTANPDRNAKEAGRRVCDQITTWAFFFVREKRLLFIAYWAEYLLHDRLSGGIGGTFVPSQQRIRNPPTNSTSHNRARSWKERQLTRFKNLIARQFNLKPPYQKKTQKATIVLLPLQYNHKGYSSELQNPRYYAK